MEKFWTGDCTRPELRQVERLLDSKAGRKIHEALFREREREGWACFSPSDRPSDARRRELRRHIARHRTCSPRRVLRVAAILTGAVLLTGVLWRQERIGTSLFDGTVHYAEISNPDGVPEHFVLPDGSDIWLAAGSTLKYPEAFAKKERGVELSGEAFFEVERDEKKPFTIRTGELETRVLGTSFKVTAFEGNPREVAVATGKVRVSQSGKELALLTLGTRVRHDPATGETIRDTVDPEDLQQWKTGWLIFHKLPMKSVAEQLENRFGVTIEFADPAVADRHVRGIFEPGEPLEAILRVLARAGEFQCENPDEKRYVIY